MLIQLKSVTLFGLSAELVEVEVDLHRGIPSFQIVGLPDAAIQESRERVRSAIKNAGFEFPRMKISINLAPANVKKQGARFDLAIAVGILAATGQINAKKLEESVLLGELSFDGSLRGIPGILPSVMGAKKLGISSVFLPEDNAEEASYVPDVAIYPITSLRQIADHLAGSEIAPYAHHFAENEVNKGQEKYDFAHVKGQEQAKRALEIAAAGGHNVLMVGPPGSGKTMLSQSLCTILPKMSVEESLEVTQLYSINGLTNPNMPIIRTRPFRAVHHTASGVAIVGGGNPPKPGEISLAHRGVLFLDEFAEFPQKTLEVLRQPLENGKVTVSRASGTCVFPANMMLVAAMNPTPSGYPQTDPRCTDSAFSIKRYQSKISGPIMDRIDIHLRVDQIPPEKLGTLKNGETSADIRNRVELARKKQKNRYAGTEIMNNSDLSSSEIKTHCPLSQGAQMILDLAVSQLDLSGRAYFRMIKIARTIADLADEDEISELAMSEAISYRQSVMGS